MDLLVASLKQAIAEVAEKKGVKRPRVLHKVNKHGEVVIALVLPRKGARLDGAGAGAPGDGDAP